MGSGEGKVEDAVGQGWSRGGRGWGGIGPGRGFRTGKRARKSEIQLWLWSKIKLNYWSSALAVFLNPVCASSGKKRTGDYKTLHFVLNSFILELTG